MHAVGRVTTPRAKTAQLERNGRNGRSSVPPLQPGDRLTVEEFERRYEAMPDLKKAELIEGVVYMSSAVRIEDHGSQHCSMVTWMGYYQAFTEGVQAGDNSSVTLHVGANRPQPDSLLRIIPILGGQSGTTAKGYVDGPPELIGETSASSASYDLHDKLHAYEKNGVQEYIVWRVEDREIDWFYLHAGKYRRLPRGKDGIYRSKVFPGLWLDADAMIAGAMKRVLAVVHEGIESPEHRKFVARLKARRSAK